MEKAGAERIDEETQTLKSPEETCQHVELNSIEVDPGVTITKDSLHKWLKKFNETSLNDPLMMAYLYMATGHNDDALEKINEFREDEAKALEELQGTKDLQEVREEERILQEIANDSLGMVSPEVAIQALGDGMTTLDLSK